LTYAGFFYILTINKSTNEIKKRNSNINIGIYFYICYGNIFICSNKVNVMKIKRAFQLKQVKISKYIFSLVYKKSVLKKEITESDLTKLRELLDEQDKLLDIE